MFLKKFLIHIMYFGCIKSENASKQYTGAEIDIPVFEI